MQRRDFLVGSLVGVGVGAGATAISNRAQDELEAVPQPAVDPKPAPEPEELKVGPSPPDGRRLSFAQQGEDVVLLDTLEKLGIKSPRYLDVGAFHPTISSNTYLLYLAGATGVLVEPNPFMVKLLTETRPKDTVLGVGVAFSEEREADYFLIRERPQLNTFSLEQVERYGGQKAIEKTIRVKLVPLVEIIEQNFDGAPDLLSVDVEGLDLEVLRSLDFYRYRPAVVCTETLVHSEKGTVAGIFELLEERGYVARGGSFVNTVFVDRQRLG